MFERALWGGGAERVVYDLAHGLDKGKFDVHIVHLFNVRDIPVTFDPAIKTHSIETLSASPLKTASADKGGAVTRIAAEVPRVLSELARRSQGLIEKARHASSAGGPGGSDVSISVAVNEFAAPILNSMPQAVVLQRVLDTLEEDAVLISIMEEASVRLWINQIFGRRPYVVSLHTAESHYMPILYPQKNRLMAENWLLENACRNAFAVIMPSMGCKDDATEYYGLDPDSVRVIRNPVNVELIRRKLKERPSVNVPDVAGKTVFVHVGRLSVEKNHELLIGACALLKERYGDFVVFCLGSGNLREKIQSMIDEHGLSNHILLLGEVANPFPYMAMAKALLLTSHFESFALVLVEAMICGAVPIAVDCPYAPREVLDNGEYGLIVPLNDPRAFADAMHRIAHDDELCRKLRPKMTERARHFAVDKIVGEWERLFSEIKGVSAKPA